MARRPYKMKKRAASLKRTRQRIVSAALELHSSIGPKNTSISNIARRAGVRRLTVYRHFPDEAALYAACSSDWLSRHPLPDPASWQRIESAGKRSAAALAALYAYYRRTAPMLKLVHRDHEEVEALQGPVQAFGRYLDATCDDLVAAWHPRGRKPKMLVATVAHALAFSTWRSLAKLGLSNAQIRRLTLGWIAAAAA